MDAEREETPGNGQPTDPIWDFLRSLARESEEADLIEPFSAKNRITCTIATDRMSIVLLREDRGARPAAGKALLAIEFLKEAKPATWIEVPFAELRAWAGSPLGACETVLVAEVPIDRTRLAMLLAPWSEQATVKLGHGLIGILHVLVIEGGAWRVLISQMADWTVTATTLRFPASSTNMTGENR